MGTLDTMGFGRIGPVSSAVPFTYRDGATFQSILYGLRDYIRNTLEPHYTGELERIIEEFNTNLDRIENQYENDQSALQALFDDFIKRIEDYVKAWVDPVAREAVTKYLDDYTSDPGTLDLFNRVFASRVTEDTARKQATLYTEFFSKLRYTQESVTICALGDSTTYGYDLVSGDRVPAPTGTLPDGSRHLRDRSPRPYPVVLESRLRTMFGAERINVINRGYSGDTTKSSFNRWITGHGAGLTLISLGINDANTASVSVAEHFEYYEKIILREINEYNSAVVILTPFKQSAFTPSRRMDAFRAGSIALAQKYGVPVVDAEPWLSNFDTSVFSDNTHMNTKGYNIIGTRAAALFVSNGPIDVSIAQHGTRYGVRPTIDPILYGPGSGIFNNGSGTGTPGENTEPGVGTGVYGLLHNTDIFYSFYTATADMEISFGLGLFPGGVLTVELDFGIDQGDNLSDHLVGKTSSTKSAPSTLLISTDATRNVLIPEARYENRIRIAAPGWHTIRLSNAGTATTRIYGVDFLSSTVFTPPVVRNTIAINSDPAVTSVGSVTWGYNNNEITMEGRITIAAVVPEKWYKVCTLPVKPRGLYYFPAEVTGNFTVKGVVRVGTDGAVEVALSGPSAAGIMLNSIRFVPAFDFAVS